MKGKAHFRSVVISLILTGLFLIPALGQATADEEARYKAQNDQMIKELKLAPEKEKAVLAVEDKYARERKESWPVCRKLMMICRRRWRQPTPTRRSSSNWSGR